MAGCARLRSVATVVTVWVVFDAILVWSTPEMRGECSAREGVPCAFAGNRLSAGARGALNHETR